MLLLPLTENFISPQDDLKKVDAIVAISGDKGQRTQTAIELYKKKAAPLIIYSGAAIDPDSPSNATVMKMMAINQGVPDSAVLIEERSTNTRENARFTAKIIKDRKLKSIILVTSPYHQRRASVEFSQALGDEVEIINYSVQEDNWQNGGWWTDPTNLYFTASEIPKIIYAWLVP